MQPDQIGKLYGARATLLPSDRKPHYNGAREQNFTTYRVVARRCLREQRPQRRSERPDRATGQLTVLSAEAVAGWTPLSALIYRSLRKARGCSTRGCA